jgi:hypothetical protein
VLCNSFQAQNLIEKLVSEKGGILKDVLDDADKFKLQIIYTQINRDEANHPSFNSFKLGVDPKRYFYPASTVKFPAAIVALEKLNDLDVKGLDKYTSLKIDSSYSGQSAVRHDSSAMNNLPSLAHYIKKIFLVSDNDAFNRIYEFIGQAELNSRLYERGISDLKLVHRLSIFLTEEENKHTNRFIFYEGDKVIFDQPPVYNENDYRFDLTDLEIGKGYYKEGELVNEPMNFATKNYISLEALHGILKRVCFPGSFDETERFNLTEADYEFLYKYMSMLPRESTWPKYEDREYYYDSYVKFFMFGDSKDEIPSNIRIFNKVGLAYGFLIDNAYIADFENEVEFLLSAVIYVNEDGILNDNQYEYDEVGIPFLAELGRMIYDYELKRNRNYPPDLSRFKDK